MRHAFSTRPHWWIAALQVVILLVAFALPISAATAPSPMTGSQLIEVLQTYGVIKGDTTGNLNLDKPITRAEMIAIIVRAQGAEADSQLFKNWGQFADAKGHWAEGYITWASMHNIVKGDGNGNVRPNDQISNAEALTLIVRMLGKESSVGGDWPNNIIFSAVELGLMPPGVSAGTAGQPAVRGGVFLSLATALTTVNLPSGKTALQTYLDQAPPEIAVNAVTSPTKEAALVLTGTTTGAKSVTVNGKAAVLTENQFSANVDLSVGNNDITVEATDLAGNHGTKQVNVTRISPVARLEVTGPDRVIAGETATYSLTAFDGNNQSTPATGLTAKVEGNIGGFDVTTGTFTAGAVTATGKITFTVGSVSKSVSVSVLGQSPKVTGLMIRKVNGGQAVSVTKSMVVEVLAVDENGAVVSDDNTRQISLTAVGTGLSVSPSVAKTRVGMATFTVRGSSPGTVTLTATAIGLSSYTDSAVFGTATRLVLRSEQTSLVIGGASSVRVWAELRDESNNLVNNDSGSDIVLSIRQTGATGVLVDDALTIRRGFSTSTLSGDDGRFSAGTLTGIATVSGVMISSHGYSIEPLNLSISKPTVGSGAKLQVLSLNNTLRPNQDTATFTVRVLDAAGTLVTDGSYAFQVQVDTSNNDPKTNGLPTGVYVYLGSTSKIPVASGSTPTGNYVYARTNGGYATISVTSTKSAEITITPVLADYVTNAYDDAGTLAAANSSRGLTAVADRVYYASAAGGVKVTVDSDLGSDQTGGSLPASTSRYFTLRAWITDAAGAWVPGGSGALTLISSSTSATTMPQVPDNLRNAVNGKAEFRVYAKASAGCDQYHVTGNSGGWTSNSVTLCATNSIPGTPTIVAVRGANGIIAGQPNLVTSVDDRLEVELASQGSERFVSVVVYRNDTNTVIYTSDAVDMQDPAPRITVPKSALPAGQQYFRVALKNGSGEGAKSAVSPLVTVATGDSGATIYSAKYDAGTVTATSGKLYVSAYGISRVGTIDTDRLTIRDASSYSGGIRLTGASATVSDGLFVIDLATVPSVKSVVENPSLFSGSDVYLNGDQGWYYTPSGETAKAFTDKVVGPFANITAVSLDIPNQQVILTGAGFLTANYDLSKLSIVQGTNSVVFNSTNIASVDRRSDTEWALRLTTAGASALTDATKFNGSDTLNAAAGWIYDGNYRTAPVTGVAVSSKVAVTRVTYTKSVRDPSAPATVTTSAKVTITGSGFFSGMDISKTGSVDRTHIQVYDLDFTPHTLTWTGSGNGVSIVSDGQIVITIDDADALLFEDTWGGSNIYLVSQSGWFVDHQGRSANAIPDRAFRLTIN